MVSTLSLVCGFLVTFTGVYLLNLSRHDPNGTKSLARRDGGDATGTDMISSIQTRMSMEARRSQGGHRLSGVGADREGLIRAYDEEEALGFGLTDLAEDTDEEHDDDPRSPMIASHQQGHANGHANGGGNGHLKVKNETIEMQPPRKPGR